MSLQCAADVIRWWAWCLFQFFQVIFSLGHFSYDDFELRSFYESKIQYYIKHTLTCDLISGKTVPWVIKSRQSKTDLWNYKSNQKKLINQCEKNAKEVCTYFFNFWKKTAFRRLFSSVNPLREKSERIYGLHAGAAKEMRQTKFIICINIYKALPVYPLT